jgi:hypothetical protein
MGEGGKSGRKEEWEGGMREGGTNTREEGGREGWMERSERRRV